MKKIITLILLSALFISSGFSACPLNVVRSGCHVNIVCTTTSVRQSQIPLLESSVYVYGSTVTIRSDARTWSADISDIANYATISALLDSLNVWQNDCNPIGGGGSGGATGPTGPTGPTGVTGATGPTGPVEMLIELTYAQLTTNITNNTLEPGQNYVITDFASNHRPPNTGAVFGYPNTIITPAVEPIIVQATSDSTISHTAESLTYPQDILHYEPFPLRQVDRAMDKGMITYRWDPDAGIVASYDWRTVNVRIFESSLGSGLYTDIIPSGAGLAYQDGLTLQNLDVRHIGDITLPPVSDSLREFYYALYGGALDAWNNCTVIKFPDVAGGLAPFPEGNLHFHDALILSLFDWETHSTSASVVNNIHFYGRVNDVKVYTDTLSAIGGFSVLPYWFNVNVYGQCINSIFKNSLLADVRYNAKVQTVMTNGVVFDHLTAFTNWGVTGADTVYMDSVAMYVVETGAITTDGTNHISKYRNVEFSNTEMEAMQGNQIRNTWFTGCEISLLSNDNWATTDPTTSEFRNWKGGYLNNSTWHGVTLMGPATGRVIYSDFQYVTASTVNFNTTSHLTITGDTAQDVTMLNVSFIAVDSLTISAVDTLTGSLENVNFYASAGPGLIGVPMNECDFHTEYTATLNIQTGTFQQNSIWTALIDNPTLPQLWTAVTVQCLNDDTVPKIAVWWDNAVQTTSTTGF